MKKPKELTPRRRPVQTRGHKRRETILDATVYLLENKGFSSVTTNAVARQAKASIGTVYEYFPNKESLFVALLDRYKNRLSTHLEGVLEISATEDWQAVVGRLFEAFVSFYRDEPGYRQLWLGSQLTDLLIEHGRLWGDSFADGLAPSLALLAPRLEERKARWVTKTCLHLVSAVVSAALQAGGEAEEHLIAEAKVAMFRYLGPYLEAE